MGWGGTSQQSNGAARAKLETRADDFGVLGVGLGDDSLGTGILEEAVVYERGHPCAHAMGSSVSVRADEHVDSWVREDLRQRYSAQ